jgi:hypothetical protein
MDGQYQFKLAFIERKVKYLVADTELSRVLDRSQNGKLNREFIPLLSRRF